MITVVTSSEKAACRASLRRRTADRRIAPEVSGAGHRAEQSRRSPSGYGVDDPLEGELPSPEAGSDAGDDAPRSVSRAPTPDDGWARRRTEGAGNTLEAGQGHERMPNRFTAMRQPEGRRPRRVCDARISRRKAHGGSAQPIRR